MEVVKQKKRIIDENPFEIYIIILHIWPAQNFPYFLLGGCFLSRGFRGRGFLLGGEIARLVHFSIGVVRPEKFIFFSKGVFFIRGGD